MSENARKLLYQYLSQHEGNVPEVYLDSKGNPTIGKGLNLNGPLARTYLQGMGYDPDKVIKKEQKIPQEDLEEVFKKIADKKMDDVIAKLDGVQLPDNQLAAITSMYYNSPKLLGENLLKALNSGDTKAAVKEIALRSNKHKDTGIAKRRLQEAEAFYGKPLNDVGFNPAEKQELFKYLDNMPDSAEKRQLANRFAYLDPSKSTRGFNKLTRNIASIPAQPEVIPSPLAVNPPEEENLIPFYQPNEPDDLLEKYNLLKGLK